MDYAIALNTNTQGIKYADSILPSVTDIKVYMTYDYSLFKTIKGNREKNSSHLKGLENSMKENYLFTIIIVNEKFEIIDGQHRFEIISKLLLPVYYIIREGYGMEEVIRFNTDAVIWKADDYLNTYCVDDKNDYKLYYKFKERYKLGHHEARMLLTGIRSNNKVSSKLFKEGKFKINNYKKAVENVEKIFSLAPYYAGYKRRSFICAMINLLKNPLFDFNEFFKKIKMMPDALVDCTNITNYIILINEIYNYNRTAKVNLIPAEN